MCMCVLVLINLKQVKAKTKIVNYNGKEAQESANKEIMTENSHYHK